MEYRVHILNVGDADAIIIKYREQANYRWITAVIDAGNIGDGEKVKSYIDIYNGKYIIDYAFCTHPDKDHKGGFFDLIEDNSVMIKKMYLMDPCSCLTIRDFQNVVDKDTARKIARLPFNHPDNPAKNLINIAMAKGIFCQVLSNTRCPEMPLFVLGPTVDYYRKTALGMIQEFTELTEDSDLEKYNEQDDLLEEEAKSVIDEEDDDSYSNMSSLVLLFAPGEKRFLLTGDANCSSLEEILSKNGGALENCILKVPHHGSKHNLNTQIINMLKPTSAVISAKGSRKHPSTGIVYWLSKYCNVYSTHKSGDLTYSSEPAKNPAIPLKKKI